MPKRMTMKVIRMMIEEYSHQKYGGHLDNIKSMARAEFLQLWYDEACLNQRQLRLPGAHPVALQRILWHLFWKNKPGSLEFVFHCIRSTLIKTDLCKKKLNIKMKKQQARWAQQTVCRKAWPDPCVFHCDTDDYIIIEQMSIKNDFSFFNISVKIGTLE